MKNNITSRQVSFVLYGIIVGYGIIDLPKNTAEVGGTGGWVSLFIATIIFIVITYMLTYLQYVHEDKTIYEYSLQLVGKFLTYVFTFVYIIYFFLFFTMINRISSETMTNTILIKTPVKYISILFYIVTGYAAAKGLNTIIRLCQIYGAISIGFSIIFSLILFTKGKLVNITPIFVTNDIMVYFKGIGKIFLPLIGMEILTVIPIKKNNNKKIARYTTLMVGVIGILYIFIIESVLSVTGVEPIIHIKASVFVVAKGIDVYSLEFLRRLDGIYIFIWMLNIVCSLSLWNYGTVTLTSKVFKGIRPSIIIIFIIILSYITSLIPKSIMQVEKFITYLSYAGIMTFFIIPFILLIVTKVKKNDKKI
ncbi:endospore germination permease [Clostridium sp. YIM B02515]|uniref:Endospore germination permease n=1 Tax=Clostridium rhizosphaerae TaxID=2803861 RepID=A0ABS1TGZ7_9CLOT|nr:endospore germination permease [Clostridium rhizosphaerae]MBL4938639.1 endospore germination permease [Clostridium rhizosphaerae]